MATKIELRFDHSDPWNQWNSPMDRPEFWKLLNRHGFEVVERGGDVVFDTLATLVEPDRPTVVFVRRDTSWLNHDCTQWAENDHVVGFMLPIVTNDPSRSISAEWAGLGDNKGKPVLSLNSMLWAETEERPYYAKHKIPKKDIDVCFIGTMHYGGLDQPRVHRQHLLQNWHKVDLFSSVALFSAQKEAAIAIEWWQTWEFIKRSKVVVSPWGVCEISWRDYEAALGECMIVKPRQPQMDVIASPWREENVVYCEQDYSDLHVAVATALAGYDQNSLRSIRSELLDMASSLEPLAEMFAERLKLMF